MNNEQGFNPNNPADKVWDAMFAQPAWTIDTPEFRAKFRNLIAPDGEVWPALIAYINEQANERANRAINQLAATPVAGWVSVEERLPEADAGPYLVASSWGVRVAYKHPPEWADGRFQDAITNCDEFDMNRDVSSTRMFVVTHWMPLPPAPVVTPTQQEQS